MQNPVSYTHLDVYKRQFPGYTVPGTVEARITATLQGRMLEIALDITADGAFACARCLEERTRRFHVVKTYCVREADLSDPDAELSFTPVSYTHLSGHPAQAARTAGCEKGVHPQRHPL